MKTIGIKLADGSFYPILQDNTPSEKVLELTTAHNNQTKVMVDLYRSSTCNMDDAEYVDSLQIENLVAHPNGEATIAFTISIDDENQLSAKIVDEETGKESNTTITLVSRTIEERLTTDEYDISGAGLLAAAAAVGSIAAADKITEEQLPDISDTVVEQPAPVDEETSIDLFSNEPITEENSDDTIVEEAPFTADEELNNMDIDFDAPPATEETPTDETISADDTISADETISEETETFDIPDMPNMEMPESTEITEETIENTETETVDNSETFDIPETADASDSFDIPDTAENIEISEPTISEDNFELPDFNESTDEATSDDTIVSEDTGITEETDLPDFTENSDLPDFTEEETPLFEDTSTTIESDDTITSDNPLSFDDDTFSTNDLDLGDLNTDSVDLGTDDIDLDNLGDENMNDNTPASGGISFTGLYDKETELGESGTSEVEEVVKKKTKVPVIICIICAIICIIATLLILFVIPSKYNLLTKKTNNTESTVIEQPLPELKEETPVVEPVPEAKEEEIIIVEKAEEVIPEQPPVAEEKPQDTTYKIKWGDTLWDIADTYYKNPWRYKYIAKFNGIKNPDYIISGTYITIPAE